MTLILFIEMKIITTENTVGNHSDTHANLYISQEKAGNPIIDIGY